MNLYAFYKGYLSKENKQSSFGQGTEKLANRTLITYQSLINYLLARLAKDNAAAGFLIQSSLWRNPMLRKVRP